MPVKTTVYEGIAGAGKTAAAIGILESRLRSGLKWYEVLFCSYSRSACREAAERAAKLTGEPIERLTQHGWFRTVHSAALRCLGIDRKSILDPESADGKKFLTEHLGAVRGGEAGTLGDTVDRALSAWDTVRARMVGFSACVMAGRSTSTESGQETRKPSVLYGAEQSLDCGSGTERSAQRVELENTETTPSGVDGTPVVLAHVTHWSVPGTDRDGPGHTQSAHVFTSKFTGPEGFARTLLPPIGESRVETTQTHGVCVMKLCAGRNPRVDARLLCSKKEEHTFRELILKYEQAKKLHGKLDFTDILLSFAGLMYDQELEIRDTLPSGFVPAEVQVVLLDEAQDCSQLMWAVVDRFAEGLPDDSGELHLLGDEYQAVYGFSGSDARLFASRAVHAKLDASHVLLNRSWRNPPQVIDWGEHILEQDTEYESRRPFSEVADGTVGLITWSDFGVSLGQLAKTDTMVIARTWWNLAKVKEALDLGGIPWTSCNEKMVSRWSCPVKIGYALVMRALAAGEMISEQDWRRVTETLNQKIAGVQMFERGAKARWKRLECSRSPEKALDRLGDWGASEGFMELVLTGRWKEGIVGAIDRAIDRFGVDVVRKPRIRIGTCHSVKGMEAEQVFCLAASTRKCAEGDFREELALKYVSVTRASRHYRLVVDKDDVARGRPMFWAAPKGEWTFLKGLPEDVREKDSGGDHSMGDETGWDLDHEGGSGPVQPSGDPGSDTVRGGAVPGDRGQDGEGEGQPAADPGGGCDPDGWWDVGGGSKFG